jgi:endonuclease/exonuclease/phosphatase family metal-dependent hydrolase
VRRWLMLASDVNLGLVALVWLLLACVSEDWWLSTVLVYLPRSLYVFPALVLLAVTAARREWSAGLNVLAALIVLGPVMGWQGSVTRLLSPATSRAGLCCVSCNVQSFRPHFGLIVQELSRINPDVVAFQEAFEDHPLVSRYFKGWHIVRQDEYLVASKFPLKLLGKCHSAAFDRVAAIRVAVETPRGTVEIYNVHQTSPRRGLKQLRPWSPITGSGLNRVERDRLLREAEAGTCLEFVTRSGPEQPVVVLGDFNMPADSSLFRRYWGHLTNAFAAGGWGYGYTSPCQTHRLWPHGWPWLQVDHILTSQHWEVSRCWVGTSNGSDHRLIAARVVRIPENDSR